MSIQDKVVIVTGASSGIGLATAKLLAEKGAKVVINSRSKDEIEAISKQIPNSLAIFGDMSKESDIRRLIEETKSYFGRIDILINNAGRGYDCLIEEINNETFHQVFDLDLAGPIIAMQTVIPIMRSQGAGIIINISSGTALMTLPNMGAYASLKRALATVSLTAREELKKDNIVVSVVYPYITLTDFEKNTIKTHETNTQEERKPPYPPDTPEFVAQKILECIEIGEPEFYVHDWMKRLGK